MFFGALSAWLGLMQFGVPQSYNYPSDYLGRGPLGWAVMHILILGLLSPLALALWLSRQAPRGEHV